MRPIIKFRNGKARCPLCFADNGSQKLHSLPGIRRHFRLAHSFGDIYIFHVPRVPNGSGNYPFSVHGTCGCGCGEPIIYPNPNNVMPWIPPHGPPYFLSGHNSRIAPNKGCFPKGNTPWNQGTKGVCKPNSGSFKKGNVPGTYRGGLYTAPNGQVLEWTGEYQPSGPRKYRPRSRRIMEEQLGRPLRDDEVVIHLDGDSSNDDRHNLKVITRAENATRNRWKGHKAKPKK